MIERPLLPAATRPVVNGLVSAGVGALVGALVGSLLLTPGEARARSSVNVSGSVYVDDWQLSNKAAARSTAGTLTPDGALKVEVDVHDVLAVSAKGCFSCHGLEMEHISLEYTPRPYFNVSAGRVVVPFGEYSNRVDSSSHTTPDAPLVFDMGRMPYYGSTGFNEGVVMLPYVDTGIVAYGQTWLGQRVQVWYGGYAVAGFRGANDLDFVSMRSAYYTDNNTVPAGGGRLALTYSQQDPSSWMGDVSIGGSYTGGRYDSAGALGYHAWGADAQARLGPVTLRGEYAARRTDIDTNASGYRFIIVDPHFDKRGWYLEAESPLGRWVKGVARLDLLERRGIPTPGMLEAIGPDARMTRYTAGAMVTPVSAFYVKGAYEYWRIKDIADVHSIHVGAGASF